MKTRKKLIKQEKMIYSGSCFLVGFILLLTLTGFLQPEDNISRTYYVDAVNGKDEQPGLTAAAPWKSLSKLNETVFQPGDVILLKCGSVWEGNLILKGSGSRQRPIRIGAFGKGKRPVINANGKANQVILLEENEGWEIENLELTNNAATQGNRTGILIRSVQQIQRVHFSLRNLYIHDVMGDYSFESKGKNTGGIGIIGGPLTRFDDIVIQDCEIGQVNRVGIWTNLTKSDQAGRGKRPITNLIIKNNTIHHCSGDGAIIRYAYRPLISHNVVYETHNAPEQWVKHGVALWCRSTDEAVFEYNEVYNTRGEMDGQAFDADLDSYKTLVQYNYSHDNEGGFMLVYGSSAETVVRYNLSVNDGKKGKHIFDFPVWVSPRGSGIFHNNTIILPVDSNVVIADEALETARFYNNVFYNQGGGKLFLESGGHFAHFKSNLYAGYLRQELTDPLAVLSMSPANILYAPIIGSAAKPARVYGKLAFTGKKPKGLDILREEKNYWPVQLGKTDLSGKKLSPGDFFTGAYKY